MKTRKTPLAGGILIPIGLLAGLLIGIRQGEPSLGVLIGIGAGLLLALLIWLLDRRSS
jgi:UDP-N-acetylmuramyl pentapeptide phosphotransferase/UDP-N-acetylglucosamine-1-phosphate transferase